MKYIPILRSTRLTVQLRELTIGQSIKLAAIPDHLSEAATTMFLNFAVESAKGIENPLDWTVQERIFAVTHYLASTSEDGPDFSLSTGKYSDYLDAGIENANDVLELGNVGNDDWVMRALTGRAAESMERLIGEIDIAPRLHWIIGGMAAQLARKGDSAPNIESESQYDEWLLGRMRVFSEYPESDFEQLMMLYYTGKDLSHHLFNIDFNDSGIVVLPRGGLDAALPPARFPVRTCLSAFALAMGR